MALTATERPGAFTRRGTALTGLGSELKSGDEAPDGELVGKSFEPVRISDYRGKVLILSCVPSLDTPVCDIETRRWEAERQALSGPIEMLTVSMDLPFAQARWCGAADVHHTTASAFRNPDFGIDYGVLLKERGILARAVFVLGKDGKLAHVDYVREITDQPDYEATLAAAREAATA